MEDMRMEIRSLLLSAKHGILLNDMQREYKDITGKPLDFRKLNFKSIGELMLSMPDVARSSRDASGEVVFHAVSDETTEHIKRLVQSQNTKKKKRGRGGRGRGGRGGRGHFRGGFASARGAAGLSGRVFSRGRRPYGGLVGPGRHLKMGEGGFTSHSQAHQYSNESGIENINPAGMFPSPLRNLQINVSPRGSRIIRTENSTFDGDVRLRSGDLREYLRDKGQNRNAVNVNAGGHTNFHQDNLSFGKVHKNLAYRHGHSCETALLRVLNDVLSSADCVDLTLLVPLDSSAAFDVIDNDPLLMRLQNEVNDNHERYKQEIAPRFQRLRQNSENKSHNAQELSPTYAEEKATQDVKPSIFKSTLGQDVKLSPFGSQDARPSPFGSQDARPSPFGSQDARPSLFSLHDSKPSLSGSQEARASPFSSQDSKPPAASQSVKPSPVYIKEKDQNWQFPEDGEEYMKAFTNYFTSRGERPPDFEIIDGKVSKQKGFYGRLRHTDVLYYPLVIQSTKQQAEMCAARMFCKENNIPLLSASVKEKVMQSPNSITTSQGSAPQFPASSAQFPNSTTQLSKSTSPFPKSQAQFPGSTPESPQSVRPSVVAQTEDKATTGLHKEIIQKIYKILKDTGIFIKALPDFYKEQYQEELSLDLMSVLPEWPDYIKLEESIPKRFIVYPVPGALEKSTAPSAGEQRNQAEAKLAAGPPRIPPCPLPIVGCVLDCTVCFYHSPAEFYVRSSKVEHHIQEIEELLNQICPSADVPEIQSLTVNSFVIGQYLGGWYRAEVKEVEPSKVKVFYIDYGNSESVVIKDLRCLPSSELIVNTPSLAIRCALRERTGAVGWCTDVDEQMEALMDAGVLQSRIIERRDGMCLVDLYHSSGFCINESLSMDGQTSPSKQDTASVRQPKPVMDTKDGMKSTDTKNVVKIDIGTAASGDATPSRLVAITAAISPLAVPLPKTPPTPVASTHEAAPSRLAAVTATVSPLAVPLPKTPPTPVASTHEASLNPPNTTQSPAGLKPKEKNVNFFPDQLVLPDTEEIAVYICDVLSECSVILRIVDSDYSDKLDALENEIADKFDSWPEPKEVRLGNIYAAAVDVDPDEFDEEGEEEEWEDCKRYHRVHVIKKLNDKYYCYFLDHGDFDHLEKSDLREMDTKLNASLPYQSVVAKLKGLDALPSEHRGFAQRALKKLAFIDDSHSFVAVLTDRYTGQACPADPAKLSRVMKIISCMNSIELEKVEQVYKDVYKEPCGDVEAVFQHIPGFGYWKECMEVDLFETEQDDDDVHINAAILDAVSEVVQGQDALGVFNKLFGTSYGSFSELDAEECDEDRDPGEVGGGSGGGSGSERGPGEACGGGTVSTKGPAGDGSLPLRRLYTWNTDAQANSAPDVSKKPLYNYWSYPLLKAVPVYVVSVESPSNFVAIPAEFQNEFESMKATLNQTLSQSAVSPSSLENNVLYAVKLGDSFHRAFYRQELKQMCKVFLPDLCQYEVVPPSQVYLLPEQFAVRPFLANNMYIGGVKPFGQSWDKEVKDWFNQQVNNKILFALVEKEEHIQQGLPPKLVVQLIDTSSEEDVILADHMIQTNMAAKA